MFYLYIGRACDLSHEAPLNGAVSCTRGNRFESTCTFSCNIGYYLSGAPHLTCQLRKGNTDNIAWNGVAPSCVSK